MSKMLNKILLMTVLHGTWAHCLVSATSTPAPGDPSSRDGNTARAESTTANTLHEYPKWSNLTQWISELPSWNHTSFSVWNHTHPTACPRPDATTTVAATTHANVYTTTITEVTTYELECICSRRSALASTTQPSAVGSNGSQTPDQSTTPIVTPANLSTSWTTPALSPVATYLSTASKDRSSTTSTTFWWLTGGTIVVSVARRWTDFPV